MKELFTILVNLRHQILHEEKTAGVIDDVRAEQAMFKDSVLGTDLKNPIVFLFFHFSNMPLKKRETKNCVSHTIDLKL